MLHSKCKANFENGGETFYGKDSFQGKENHGKFRFVEKTVRENLAE